MKMEMFAVFAIACLLFGCFGGGGGNGGTPTATPYHGGGGAATPTATPYNGGGGVVTPTPYVGGGGLAGLGWSALIALGTPVQCTVRSGDQIWDMKIKGDNYRAEGDSVSDGQTTHVMMIGKGDAVYMQMTAEMRQMPGAANCAWLRMEANSSGTGGGTQTTDYDSMPPENMTCSPALFGDDVFATPGNSCTMDDLIGGAMPTPNGNGGNGDACAYCASISDPDARAACLQYCGG